MRVCFFFILIINVLFINKISAQTFVFGQLTGSPNMLTTGWNLTGNAYVGDTPGDLDNFSNELVLTNVAGNQSGAIFYNTPINLTQCQKWTVEFEYRIWGGSAADGLAYCFIDVPPAGFVPGGGVGIPGTANGLKVILDTWNNCGGPNPELQIYNGIGYNECAAGIVKIDNSMGNLGFVRSNAYQPAKITYDNGVVTLFINNIQYLTANFPIGFTGYMGFTASTGGATDQHSIRNVIIYTEQATSNAGVDVSTCSGENVTIGAPATANYIYNWTPSTGLNSTTAANPVVNITNTTGAPITQTYTVTTSLSTAPGLCPTTDQIVVTIQPEFTQTSNQVSCTGQYVFNGQTLTQSGTYQDTLNTIHGCDSVVTLNLTMGIVPLANAGQNLILCSNEMGQLGQTPATGLQYAWTPTTGLNNPNIANPTVAWPNLNTGAAIVQTYTLTVTDALGAGACSASDQVDVTVQPAYQHLIVDTLCNGGPFFYNGQSFSQTGTYIDSSLTSSGCDSITIIDIVISQDPIFVVADTSICIGQIVTFTPQSAFSNVQYFWLANGASVPVTAPSITLAPNNSIAYTVTAIDPYLCNYSDVFNVQVEPLPNTQLIANQTILCAYDTLILSASGADLYTWIGPVNFSPGALQQIITPVSGTYEVIGTSLFGCQENAVLQINVNPAPSLTITPDQGICPGFSANITVTGASNYVWTDPSLSGSNLNISPLQTTSYTVIGSNIYNCIDSAQTTVTVYAQPFADFIADPLILTNDDPTVSFTNNSLNAAMSFWNFGDGTSQESSQSEFSYTYPFVEDQNYTVTLQIESTEGCVDQTQVQIQIKGGIIYYVPNSFTPDGDEHNNIFKPIFTSGFDPQSYHLTIFNRWGGTVFESFDKDKGWDGTMNYLAVPEGMYSFKISFKSVNNDDIHTINGHVLLMR